MSKPRLGIRWTIGDVSPAGFEALRLSVHSAQRLFGQDADYLVCVNTISVADAQRRAGPLPQATQWCAVPKDVPAVLRGFVANGMAEGVAWKFIPLSAFPGRHELALDNDVILWEVPPAIQAWLDDDDPMCCVVAADDTPAHGKFADLCGSEPRNSGIRGTAPGFDIETALGKVLERQPVTLESELDEQGLQIAALSFEKTPRVVPLEDVSICSPFYPHNPALGRCGAHFIGLNARQIAWEYHGRPATEVRLAHWRAHRKELCRRAGLDPEDSPEQG